MKAAFDYGIWRRVRGPGAHRLKGLSVRPAGRTSLFAMGFEYMRVYQAGTLLDTLVLALVQGAARGFARDIDQLLRAVASVLLNIAEAYGSEQPGKKINHLEIARGSVNEARAALQRLVRRGAFTEKQIQRPSALTKAIAKMLTSWIAAVKAVEHTPAPN